MKLLTWEPVVDGRDGKLMEFALEVLVQCPSCKTEVTICSTNGVLGPVIERTLSLMIENKTRELNHQWTCLACGIVSALPKADFDGLVAQVTQKVTPAWIKEQMAATLVASEEPDPVEEPDDDEEDGDEEKGEPVPLEA